MSDLFTISKSNFIILRARKITSGYSLFLDIHYKKKRYREFLKLYLTSLDKKKQTPQDKDALNLADLIKNQRHTQIITGTFGESNLLVGTVNDYFSNLAKERELRNDKSRWKWISCANHFDKCLPSIQFDSLNRKHGQIFKDYLISNLAPITAWTYWNVFQQMLNQAVKDKYIKSNPVDIRGIKKIQTERQYLILSELQKVDLKVCDDDEVKRAFLFSCFTGLRFGDIQKLRYKDITKENDSYILKFRQNKTGQLERLTLPNQALKYLNFEQEGTVFVLKDLRYTNDILKPFVKSCGINKHITFHCARHTFATLALTSGIDVYTVSKLLGHREVRTTEIYAKIIDSKKAEASKMMPVL